MFYSHTFKNVEPMLNFMKAHLAKSPIGYFAFDDNQKLIAHKLFKLSPEEALKKIREDIDEDFLSQLKGLGEVAEDELGKKALRKNLRKLAISLGAFKNDSQFTEFMAGFGLCFSSEKLKNAIKSDAVIVQAYNSLDSINKFLNILTEHFKEWFRLHYPECEKENEELIYLVIEHGSRENFPSFSGSYGIAFKEQDKDVIRSFALQIRELMELKKKMENYIEQKTIEIAPNFSFLVGGLTAARMIALAGSFHKLANMPSNTIQLLGAEKALFRHLKNRKCKPPKFGILFDTPYVRRAPEDKKGKVARIVASWLSKAAKIDYYSKRDESKNLKAGMEKEIKMVIG